VVAKRAYPAELFLNRLLPGASEIFDLGPVQYMAGRLVCEIPDDLRVGGRGLTDIQPGIRYIGQRKALINPEFRVSRLLRTMSGEQKYLSPRKDGETSFFVSEALCERYAWMEMRQFEGVDGAECMRTLGFFAENDELTRCGDMFEAHYPGRAVFYPGGHLPSFPEVKRSIAPILLDWLATDR